MKTDIFGVVINSADFICYDAYSVAGAGNFKTESDESELPPIDFIVSPIASPCLSLSSSDALLSTDILHKRGLVGFTYDAYAKINSYLK